VGFCNVCNAGKAAVRFDELDSSDMFVHDQVPPGVPVMKEKRDQISYSVEEVLTGARVRIKTSNVEALKAVHDFLRFQIEDHHTGDATDISAP
jgi:hypothetical protein